MRLRRKINIALTHARNVRVLVQHPWINHCFLFRRFGGGEFLEARIIPERIETSDRTGAAQVSAA